MSFFVFLIFFFPELCDLSPLHPTVLSFYGFSHFHFLRQKHYINLFWHQLCHKHLLALDWIKATSIYYLVWLTRLLSHRRCEKQTDHRVRVVMVLAEVGDHLLPFVMAAILFACLFIAVHRRIEFSSISEGGRLKTVDQWLTNLVDLCVLFVHVSLSSCGTCQLGVVIITAIYTS